MAEEKIVTLLYFLINLYKYSFVIMCILCIYVCACVACMYGMHVGIKGQHLGIISTRRSRK